MAATGDLTLQLELTDGTDPDLLERLAQEVRAELLEAEVAEAVGVPAGAAPAGAKSAEWLEVGALSLQLFVYSIKAIECVKKAIESRGLKGTLHAANGASLNLVTAEEADQDQFLKVAQ
jgi:hypothetical protein